MLNKLKYSSIIKDYSLLFLETKKVAIMIDEGFTYDQVICKSIENNIFQLNKEYRRKYLPVRIIKRLKTLNENQIHMITIGDLTISKLLIFIALIKTDRLFFEFMLEVYKNKRDTIKILEDKDFMIFFEHKAESSSIVAKWKTPNLEKVKSAYKKILLDVGLLYKSKDELTIIKPILDIDSINAIRQGNEIIVDTFL